MTFVHRILATLLFLCFTAPYSSIAGPYIEFGVGVTTRDVVEEGLTEEGRTALVDPETGADKLKSVGNADSTRVLAEIGWNFADRVQLYGTVGGVDLKIDEFDNFNGNINFALGGGAKVNWYTSPSPSRLSVFTDFSALTFKSEDTIATTFFPDGAADPVGFVGVADEKIRWTEYTLKLGVSMVHPILDRPYGGIRLSKVNGTDTVTFRSDQMFAPVEPRKLDLEEDDNFGLFAGTTLFFDQQEKAGLNLELNVIDEFSFIAAFRLNF